MTFQTNHGTRPSGLSDADHVRVILEIQAADGRYSHHGDRVWPVASRQGAVQWGLDRPIRIKEWERVG